METPDHEMQSRGSWGGKKEKERKRTEHQEPQGFKGKTVIVENFFGLKGQEREKTDGKEQKKALQRCKALIQ